MVIADLLMAHRITPVRFLRGYLLEHGVDQDVDTCIVLDHVLELSQDRVQFLRVVFHTLDDTR